MARAVKDHSLQGVAWWGTHSPTLPILMDTLEECKLLGIVYDHELLEQPLDDLIDCGGAADVQLLDSIKGQVEGRPLVRGGGQVHIFDSIIDRLGPDSSRHCHWPPKLQMHFDEACVGAIFTLCGGGGTIWGWICLLGLQSFS